MFFAENHSFLCWPNCSIQHHKLIQLLCATPDHNSITTPAAEQKSCSNFRNYLKETAWDLSAVVPDPLPLLCYSVVHLACLLGKHKALDVLSEFGFHPLVHTAITEETPLHMTLRLLQYQPSGSLFLCNSVVSIVKILNRHSHAISLFSAKDYKGDTVLHSLAKMFLPKKQVHESIELVYLFRVFVHFLLKGQTSSSSVTHQILSSSLSDCNKRGESVEAILRRSAEGKEILKYLTGLMGRSAKDDSPGVLDGTNSEFIITNNPNNNMHILLSVLHISLMVPQVAQAHIWRKCYSSFVKALCESEHDLIAKAVLGLLGYTVAVENLNAYKTLYRE